MRRYFGWCEKDTFHKTTIEAIFTFTGHMTRCSICLGDRGIYKTEIFQETRTAAKCSCISRPLSGNERRGLPGAVANILLKIMENCQTEVSNGEKSVKSNDSSMTASAVVALEIKRLKFRTSTPMQLGMTWHERRKHGSAAQRHSVKTHFVIAFYRHCENCWTCTNLSWKLGYCPPVAAGHREIVKPYDCIQRLHCVPACLLFKTIRFQRSRPARGPQSLAIIIPTLGWKQASKGSFFMMPAQ